MHYENDYDIISSSDVFHCAKNTDAETNHYAKFFCNAIREITSNSSFNSDAIKKRKLLLCEAYVLLWQHSNSLTSADHKPSCQMKVGTLAAMFLDLQSHKKITLEENCNNLSTSDKKGDLVVRVIDTEPTFTFLDRVILTQLSRDAQSCNYQARKLSHWLNIMSDTCAVNACYQNLVSRGILTSSTYMNNLASQKYSNVNFSVVQQLEKEIKSVCLNERKPDIFILSLMTFTFEENYSFLELLLRQISTSRELKVAMENMKTIVKSQGKVLKSPKFVRKKFSMDKPHHHHHHHHHQHHHHSARTNTSQTNLR